MELKQGEKIEDLGHGLKIIQSDRLYRFTSDAIRLTKFASAKKGDVVADFCSGSGVIALHFYGLHGGVVNRAVLFELQSELADMSERSIALNGLGEKFNVVRGPLQQTAADYRAAFSLVLCNPPYERAGTGERSGDEHNALARHEGEITLGEVVHAAALVLKFGGRLAVCHRADRLVDLLSAMRNEGVEPKRCELVSGKGGRPYLALVEGTKGGKPGLLISVSD